MANTGFFHHIGTFLLFSATILLVITDISAPVVNDISLLRIQLPNATSEHDTALTFGTFGYCVINTAADNADFCSDTHVGYDPTNVIESIETSASFSKATRDTAKALTRVMVLHPVATGISFLGFLLAVGAGVIGSFLASLTALVAFAVTLVVLITDFVMFSLVRRRVNDLDGGLRDATGNSDNGDLAHYGAAMWTTLVATICLLLGTIVVFATCCSSRLHSQSKGNQYAGDRRRRFGFN